MALTMIYSATLHGVEPVLVEIEIDLSPGLPFFQIVGLPDEVLRESKTRVKSAIQQAGFDFPYESRLVLNLAPSKLKKEGSAFELALAAKILHASSQIPMPEKNVLILGELALDGSVRSVSEMTALSLSAELESRIDLLVIPVAEAAKNVYRFKKPVVAIAHIKDLKIDGWWEKAFVPEEKEHSRFSFKKSKAEMSESPFDFSNCEVSEFWAEHLKIAAVGQHHYLLSGSPGCGKTFFAEAVKELRQTLEVKQEIKTEILHSFFDRQSGEIPWSAPHHSATLAGMIGGGVPPRPGAVTRAHRGILFLDELLEFSPSTLDGLREPLEKGFVDVARAGQMLRFPSNFQLIAATNPCRCGFWNHSTKGCTCSQVSRQRYRMKLSGPLLDRFDLTLPCPSPLGSEKKVSGKEILRICKEAEKFKTVASSKTEPFSERALDFMNYHLGKKIRSHRQHQKLRRLSLTLMQLEQERNVSEKHVERAMGMQDQTPFGPKV